MHAVNLKLGTWVYFNWFKNKGSYVFSSWENETLKLSSVKSGLPQGSLYPW